MTGRRMVVAVDGSDSSDYAVEWAIKNVFKEGDHALLLSATSSAFDLMTADTANEYPMSVAVSPVHIEDQDRQLTKDGVQLVNHYIAVLKAAKVEAEGEVVKGDAGSWIVQEADKFDADAIIMGSHGYGIVKRTIMGSISDYVKNNSSRPLVLVRTPKEGVTKETNGSLCRKIVIAVDGTEPSVQAFMWALTNFCTGTDNVVILHVQEPVLQPTSFGTGQFGIDEVYIPPQATAKDDVEMLRVSEKLVEKYMTFAEKEAPKIHCEGMIVSGQAEDQVIKELELLQADAVVVGSQDKGFVGRTLLGSVSDYLAHSAPCPVIIVKAGSKAAAEDQHLHAQ
eukprot:TRINITY_DN20781_c0_g1_i1.p1 TRINITY_DN20781_c0_g1~~TRINITY_DN20781_c0_g1_i1.p1  ORF type:complete len:338 (-),score=78.04 TRINITY_DN20781_c0_g1_i1:603-1616(-)